MFLCILDCPETYSLDQADLELNRDLPVSVSYVLGLKACATAAQLDLESYSQE